MNYFPSFPVELLGIFTVQLLDLLLHHSVGSVNDNTLGTLDAVAELIECENCAWTWSITRRVEK